MINVLGSIQPSGMIRVGGTLELGDATNLGGISVGTAGGLQGQVIINGANSSPAGTLGGPVIVSGQTIPRPAPGDGSYAPPSSTYGGGAVGLVPYKLYASDCSPPHHDNWVVPAGEPHILNSRFNGTVPNGSGGFLPKVPVRMQFYGPVKTSAAQGVSPVAVWLWVEDSGGVYRQWHNVTSLLNVTVARGNDPMSRELSISPTAAQGALPPGYYAITAIREGSNRLYCDGTLAQTPPTVDWNISATVGGTTYYYTQHNFQLFSDCNKNDVEDVTEIAANPNLDTNDDGFLDECVPAEPHCPADLDDGTWGGIPDAGVSIDDLLFFMYGFENGIAVVDLDNDGDPAQGVPDGGVDINDLLYFLAHFEMGC